MVKDSCLKGRSNIAYFLACPNLIPGIGNDADAKNSMDIEGYKKYNIYYLSVWYPYLHTLHGVSQLVNQF